MSGIDFVITGGAVDTSLPIAPSKDRIIAHGALMLIDAVHSADPMASGITNSQRVPNIAWEEAAELLGSGTQSSLSSTFLLGTGNTIGTVLTERSSRGGIHVIMAQTGQTVNTQGAQIDLPEAVKAYMTANPNNAYYISRWAKKTRAMLSGGPSEGALYANGVSAVGNSLFNIIPAGLQGAFSETLVSPSINPTGNQFLAMATSSWQGTDPGTISSFAFPVAWGQRIGSYQTSTFNNRSSSYVFYRMYIEDLTVSGRSFAEVSAIDKSFFDRDMATGGRYAGDTFTNPATLP